MSDEEKDKIKEQVKNIARTGRYNMTDIDAVCSFANRIGYKELVNLITNDEDSYTRLILTGEL